MKIQKFNYKNNYILLILVIFSVYCSIKLGETWDQHDNLVRGKITLEYLLSFGKSDVDILARQNYSTIYWTAQYLLSQIFFPKFQIQATHLINLLFSFGVIFGISRLCKEMFNSKIGNIVFLILFFYPIFFGHMSINSKDTILALSHVWIVYLVLKYLKNQGNEKKTNFYIINIGILTALATGIQLLFLGSLLPVFLFILFEVCLFKKIIKQDFNIKKFLFDLFKCFIIFYLLLIIFWIDTHQNIILLPYKIFLELFSTNYWTGWPYNLINGEYFLSREVPKLYLLINLFFKSPEYFLFTYVFFFFFFFSLKAYFTKEFNTFSYYALFIIFLLIFTNTILFIVPYPIYDGVRLFLWTLPYYCIIPGLVIYYLIQNFKYIKIKIASLTIFLLFIYHLVNFLSLTPYHYTYLNYFNGKSENRYTKFENDYWGASIKELIKNASLNDEETILFATCGINPKISKKYLKKYGYVNFRFVSLDEANIIIMTNRVTFDAKDNVLKNPINCFDKFKGQDISRVERNGLTLSLVRMNFYNSLQ